METAARSMRPALESGSRGLDIPLFRFGNQVMLTQAPDLEFPTISQAPMAPPGRDTKRGVMDEPKREPSLYSSHSLCDSELAEPSSRSRRAKKVQHIEEAADEDDEDFEAEGKKSQQDSVSTAVRRQKKIQEKNRRAQARFRDRQKVLKMPE